MGSKNTLLSGIFLFQVSNPGSRQNMINCQGSGRCTILDAPAGLHTEAISY